VNILSEILNSGNGQVLRQMANQFGLDESDARNAIASLLPALAAGLKKNTEGSKQGTDDLLSALIEGNHSGYVEDPDTLTRDRAVEDGNSILGHILGSKDVSRKVAGKASTNTGIAPDVLKSMLPILATVVMGALSKQTSAGSGGGQGIDALTSFIDLDGDGSVADDLLDFARKLF
jgi:hypothetical protein